MLAVSVMPVGAAVEALAAGWAPTGDDATVVLRSGDVLRGDLPITGMRSTSGDTGQPELATHHLGPVAFYLFALPLAVTGGSPAGVVLACAAIGVAASLLSVLWGRRLGDDLGVLLVAGGLLVTQWFLGPRILVTPLNPYPAQLPTFLALVLVWAVARGHHRALPALALATSLVLQAHLAFVPLAGALALVVAVILLVRRRARGGRRAAPAHRRSLRRALGLTLLVWLPSLVEVVVHDPDNPSQVARWATSSTGESIGLPAAAQHLSLLAPLPGGLRRASDDLLLGGSGLAAAVGAGLLVLLAVIATGWRVPHGRSSSVQPARIALLANLVMLATASRLPDGLAAPYWVLTWIPVVGFTWFALAWRAVAWLPAARPTLPRGWLLPAGAAATITAAALAIAATPPVSAQDEALARSGGIARGALGEGGGRHVQVQGLGFRPLLSVAPAVALELRRAGWEPHYLVDWRYPEDANHLWVGTAPETADQILITDSTEPQLVEGLPAQAQQIGSVTLPDEGNVITLYRVPGG